MESQIKQRTKVCICSMRPQDMPKVLQIEKQSLEIAWVEEDFLNYLRQHYCVGMVAKHNGKIVGFIIYDFHEDKLHIVNLAIHSNWRRQNIGAQIVAKVIGNLSSRYNTLTVELRETNLVAQLFFRQQGFRAIKVLRNYYKSGDDAYLMEYRPADASGNANNF